jgi:phage shock protein PspC (stress-responsive transcriptional regulator)
MKKLHRLAPERKLAGVCAGLGEYFDLDPVFFRLMFLFSIFFGGLGAIAYVLMWIMVPEQTETEGEPRPARRLYLSDTDRKIAGVCGGLGEWLEVDPVLFRVAFVLLAFVGGIGVFAYVVLWLLIPRHGVRTVAQA